jgi:hypothetical protein
MTVTALLKPGDSRRRYLFDAGPAAPSECPKRCGSCRSRELMTRDFADAKRPCIATAHYSGSRQSRKTTMDECAGSVHRAFATIGLVM